MAELKAEINIMDLPVIKEKLDIFEKRIAALEGQVQELREIHINVSGIDQMPNQNTDSLINALVDQLNKTTLLRSRKPTDDDLSYLRSIF